MLSAAGQKRGHSHIHYTTVALSKKQPRRLHGMYLAAGTKPVWYCVTFVARQPADPLQNAGLLDSTISPIGSVNDCLSPFAGLY